MECRDTWCDSGRLGAELFPRVQKVDKVQSVQVSLETGIACVEVEADTQMDALDLLPNLFQALQAVGFQAEIHFGDE